jgi:hypothetical protein
MSKEEWRAQLAALSFTEKVRILEKLRDRSLAIASAGLRTPENYAAQSFGSEPESSPPGREAAKSEKPGA